MNITHMTCHYTYIQYLSVLAFMCWFQNCSVTCNAFYFAYLYVPVLTLPPLALLTLLSKAEAHERQREQWQAQHKLLEERWAVVVLVAVRL